jgi:hypothetical protein
LEKKVREAGVRDASNHPVAGFLYLRTSRFLSGLGKHLQDTREQEEWVRYMQELDLGSRKKEIRNLPDEMILSMGWKRAGHPDREGLFQHVQYCSQTLLDHDRTQSEFYENLYPRAEVADEYSFLRRVIGLYPLFVIPVLIGTKNARGEFASWYGVALDELPIGGNLVTFTPSEGVFLPEGDVQALIERSRANPLRVPLLRGEDERRVVAHFAPIIIQDISAPYDQFGRVVWQGHRLGIDGDHPSVYYYVSHALHGREPILQINYVIWYAARAGEKSPWIERGHFDGLTARVSLDSQGRPLMVDVMNNCGCYHFFVPKRERLERDSSKFLGLSPFVPQWLPEIPRGKRLAIRVNSGWHQVERLLSFEVPPNSVPYELLPYELLEMLPREDGGTESMFTAEGIVKGSARKREEVLLFSMGVPSIGSLRQRGHNPIALVGRAHFDDPFLFEKNFVFR